MDQIIEKLEPDFISPVHGIARQQLSRVASEFGPRFYLQYNEEGEVEAKGLGITSFIDLVLPKNAFFYDWLKKMGNDADPYVKDRQEFGSLFHTLKSELTQKGQISVDYDYLLDRAKQAVSDDVYRTQMVSRFIKSIQKGLLSWAQFMVEKEYEPMAIEVSYLDGTNGIAATLDDVGTMLWKGKRQLVNIDTKSNFSFKKGAKSYFDAHEAQLAFQKRLFMLHNQAFREQKMHLFNWSPNEWTKEPTYTLKDQTASPFNDVALQNALLVVAKKLGHTTKTVTKRRIGGVVTINGFDPKNYITEYSY